jgi:hypothetical protein
LFGDHMMTCSVLSKPMHIQAANQTHGPKANAVRLALKLFAAITACGWLAACNSATESNHPLRGPTAFVGWSTTAGEPKDFVKARRGTAELAYVPIGRGGIERPVTPRNPEGVKNLEAELDRQRDQSENFARRQLPAGAYGQPLPSVAAPPRAQRAGLPERPTPGQPESYPVNPNRLRQIRENSRQVNE